MATRRRSPGFTTPKEEETKSIEEFLDANAREMFETISRKEEEAEVKNEVVEPEEKPAPMQVILPEITPVEDMGHRFEEEIITPAPKVSAPSPQIKPPPKRHPRNIPKFSRHK